MELKLETYESDDKIPKHELDIQKGEGGIDQTNTNSKSIMKIVGSFIKKITKKMFTGHFNFSSMQRPSIVSSPATHLQILAREFCIIIKHCKKILKEKDDLEKFKHLISGILGNFTYNVFRSNGKSPINPMLGETFSGKMEDGTLIYLEQVNMTPFSTYVHIIGPNNDFELTSLVRVF